MFGRKNAPSSRPRRRPLQIESLESRNMLSASPVAIPLTAQTSAAVIASPVNAPPDTAHGPYSPAMIRTAYGFNPMLPVELTGAGQTIAIIVAGNLSKRFAIDTNGKYDFSKPLPSLQDDLNTFDQRYNLSATTLDVRTQDNADVFIDPTPTAARQHWEIEAAIDVEWAHAIAPGAKIVLFEAKSGSLDDLAKSAQQAANLPGVSVVSMSFAMPEFAAETNYDRYFTTPAGHAPVTFVAGSGDTGNRSFDSNGNLVATGGPQYPAASPNVLAVGGTNLTMYPDGHYYNENGWSWDSYPNDTQQWASGGGIGQYEAQPAYQASSFPSLKRTTPDVAYNGDIFTPYSVYFSDNVDVKGQSLGPQWTTGAGTSEGTPQWAAIIAIVNQGRVSHNLPVLHSAISDIYALRVGDFHDVFTGNNGFAALGGYDLVTGRGSPKVDLLIPDLINFQEARLIVLPPFDPGTIYGNVSNVGNTQMAMAITPFLGGLSTPPATDLTAGNLLDPVRISSPSHSINSVSTTPLALKPLDLSALLATAHSDDQVDRLIDSLFDFGGLNHPRSNVGTKRL